MSQAPLDSGPILPLRVATMTSLDSTRLEVRALTEQLVRSEHRSERLLALYVALYQLHATLDPQEVLSAVSEIARDILGAESFLVLMRLDPTRRSFDIALREGDAAAGLLPGKTYSGGDPKLDQALESCIPDLENDPRSKALAVIPLLVEGEVVGALIIAQLYCHRPPLAADADTDLFDLLAAHVGSALCAAQAYASNQRSLLALRNLLEAEGDAEASSTAEGATLSGRLRDVPVSEILQFIHLGRRTGTLSIHHQGALFELELEKGRIAYARRDESMGLGSMLERNHLLSSEGLRKAKLVRRQLHPDRPLFHVLIASGAMTSESLLEAVEREVVRTVEEVVVLTDGYFSFYADHLQNLEDISVDLVEAFPPLSLNTEAVVLDVLRRFDEGALGSPTDEPGDTGAVGGSTSLEARPRNRTIQGLLPAIDVVSNDSELIATLHSLLLSSCGQLVAVRRSTLAEAGVDEWKDLESIVLLDSRMGRQVIEEVSRFQDERPWVTLVAICDDPSSASAAYRAGAAVVIPSDPVAIAKALAFQLASRQSSAGGRSRNDLERMHRVVSELRSGLLCGSLALNLMNFLSDLVERAVLFLVEKESLVAIGAFGLTTESNLLAQATHRLSLSRDGESIWSQTVKSEEVKSYSWDKVTLPESLKLKVGRPKNGQIVLIPVVGTSGAIAVVYCDNGERPRSIDDLRLFELVASQVAYAFENELLRRRCDPSERLEPP